MNEGLAAVRVPAEDAEVTTLAAHDWPAAIRATAAVGSLNDSSSSHVCLLENVGLRRLFYFKGIILRTSVLSQAI